MRAADVEQRERKLQAPWAKVMGWPVGSRVRAQATQSGLWEEGGAAGEWGAAGSRRASRESPGLLHKHRGRHRAQSHKGRAGSHLAEIWGVGPS